MKIRRISIVAISIIIISSFLIGGVIAAALNQTMNANTTNVKVDGEVVAGLQSIEYQVTRQLTPIYSIGADQPTVDVGQVYINGTLKIVSTHSKLDNMFTVSASNVHAFQLVIENKVQGQSIKTLTFDECFVQDKTFSMEANGVGITEYTFFATRIREQ